MITSHAAAIADVRSARGWCFLGLSQPLRRSRSAELRLLSSLIRVSFDCFPFSPENKVPSLTQQASLLANLDQCAKDELKRLLRAQATLGVALANDGSTSCAIQSCATHADHFRDRGWALWSSVLEFHRFKGRSRSTADNLAADLRGAVKRFEPSTGPREEFPKVTTVTRYEAANKVASGKLRDEADG